jgi:hypothetical protein
MADKYLFILSFLSLVIAPLQMALKYQSYIDALKLSIICPDNLSQLKEDIEVYRLSYSPISHENNFLPNVIFDPKRNITFFDYSEKNTDEGKKCLRCGASFFKNVDKAIATLKHLSGQIKQSYGYTCIAKGSLNGEDGLIKHNEKGDHFTLYEFEGVELAKKFEIINE